jgi:hypothetical protein
MRVTIELGDKRLKATVPDVEELDVNGSALPGLSGLSYVVKAKNSHGGEVLELAGIDELEILQTESSRMLLEKPDELDESLSKRIPNVPLQLLARAELVVAGGRVVKSRHGPPDATLLVVDGEVQVVESRSEPLPATPEVLD